MRTRLNKPLLIVTLFLFTSCAVSHAPYGWLPYNAKEVQTEAFGGWAEVSYSTNKSSKDNFLMGELIAVSKDSLFVLDQHGLVTIPSNDVKRARVFEYRSHAGEMGAWAFLGTLSTASHGWYAILTAPLLWILGGTIVTASRTHETVMKYPGRSLYSFRAYARFPQGLPKNLDRNMLTHKQISY